MSAREPAPDLTSISAGADLEAAVAWVLTFTPGDGAEVSDADLLSVMTAADAYRRAALLSLAEALEAEAEYGGQHVAVSAAFRRSARMARERAASALTLDAAPGLVSSDSPPPSASVRGRLSATDGGLL